jgi:hypothetical protein
MVTCVGVQHGAGDVSEPWVCTDFEELGEGCPWLPSVNHLSKSVCLTIDNILLTREVELEADNGGPRFVKVPLDEASVGL